MSANTRPDLLTFQIIWLGYDEDEIGWDEIRQHDLTDAIAAACIRMSAGRGFAAEAHGFFVRRKEDDMDAKIIHGVSDSPFEVPEPSDYDVENLGEILRSGSEGPYDWFDAMLFRLILKADGTNTELLRMVYPFHVKAFEDWRNR